VTLVAWKRETRLWLPALVLLLVNVGAYVAYRALYAGEAQSRRTEVARARAEYERVVGQRERAQALAAQAVENQERLEALYRDRFMTQEQRITRVIAEVKELTQKAGLDPPAIRYPDEPIESLGLVKRSIVFGVEGSYQALRTFINLLERTESFVILEEIRPGERADGRSSRLSIDLKVATFFLDDGVDPAALARSRDAVGAAR